MYTHTYIHHAHNIHTYCLYSYNHNKIRLYLFPSRLYPLLATNEPICCSNQWFLWFLFVGEDLENRSYFIIDTLNNWRPPFTWVSQAFNPPSPSPTSTALPISLPFHPSKLPICTYKYMHLISSYTYMCVYNFFVINLNVNIYLCMVCFFMRTEGLYIKQVTLPSAQPTINEPKKRPRLLFFTSRYSPPPP